MQPPYIAGLPALVESDAHGDQNVPRNRSLNLHPAGAADPLLRVMLRRGSSTTPGVLISSENRNFGQFLKPNSQLRVEIQQCIGDPVWCLDHDRMLQVVEDDQRGIW